MTQIILTRFYSAKSENYIGVQTTERKKMSIIFTGHVYALELEGRSEVSQRSCGYQGMFEEDVYYWSGLGIIMELANTQNLKNFRFHTTVRRHQQHSLENSLFACFKTYGGIHILDELPIIDREAVVDWMGKMIWEGVNNIFTVFQIPELDLKELTRLGAMADRDGQVHLGI